MGAAARNLFDDAQKLLRRIIDEKLLVARAVVGFWPAARLGSDDIEVYTDETRSARLAVLHCLRQQQAQADGRPNLSLADYVAPAGGPPDWVGAFAVSTGFGADELAARFQAEHDDYASIMTKALADRLAESLAEHMHRLVRREFWGYAPAESLANEDLIRERYRGIRPAPGYPACPDHTEKRTLFSLLDAERSIGMHADRELRDAPGRLGQRLVFRPPRVALFRRGQDRARPAGGPGGPQGHVSGRDGALAAAEPGLGRAPAQNMANWLRGN